MEYTQANCRQVIAQLFQFIDGEADAADCAGIKAHLERCAPCMDHVTFQEEVKVLVRRKCSEGQAPSELSARLRERLSEFLQDSDS